MKPKLLAIFLLLVLSPLALLAWLGWRTAADERTRVQTAISEAYTSQLAIHRNEAYEVITDVERELGVLFGYTQMGAEESRMVIRSHRFVRQMFVLDGEGRFLHPPADENQQTQAEKDFLQRSESVWLSGEKFSTTEEGAAPLTAEPPPIQSDRTVVNFDPKGQEQQQVAQRTTEWTKNATERSQQAWALQNEAVRNTSSQDVQAAAPVNFATDQGWHSWFHGEGVNLIFWNKNPWTGVTTGIEVDREALMAYLIVNLPTETHADLGTITLTDASARPIYQWGEQEPATDAIPDSSLPLFAPLSMWHLNHFAPTAKTVAAVPGNLLSLFAGLGAAALLLTLLAFYFYRENSREMRTAAEKVTFVNQVSHELKTPLTNIRMYAELAEEKVPEEESGARRCLDIVVDESQRLSRLIGNVLTFARPKAQEPNPTSNRPDELVRTTLEHFRPAFEAQEIEIDFQPGAADPVMIDADILEQILGNLFSNVEKYAAKGKSIRIETALRKGGDLTEINVTDHGPGIPKSQRGQIFEPFHRLSNRLSDGVSGTGIGLTIARDLARRHGGDLTLTDQENNSGCRFTITLATPRAEN